MGPRFVVSWKTCESPLRMLTGCSQPRGGFDGRIRKQRYSFSHRQPGHTGRVTTGLAPLQVVSDGVIFDHSLQTRVI